MSTCDKSETLHDYAFDELPAAARGEMEQHLAACEACAAELNQLRFTTAALRILPDKEVPQRIAFVSDKIFEPSPVLRFFRSAWAGFGAAAVMAAALVFTVLHQPAPNQRATQAAEVLRNASGRNAVVSRQEVAEQIDRAVAKAVRQVREEVRQEDAQVTQAALAAVEARHEREHRLLVAEMEQNLEVMQKRMGTLTSLASLDAPRNGYTQ